MERQVHPRMSWALGAAMGQWCVLGAGGTGGGVGAQGPRQSSQFRGGSVAELRGDRT